MLDQNGSDTHSQEDGINPPLMGNDENYTSSPEAPFTPRDLRPMTIKCYSKDVVVPQVIRSELHGFFFDMREIEIFTGTVEQLLRLIERELDPQDYKIRGILYNCDHLIKQANSSSENLRDVLDAMIDSENFYKSNH